MLTSNAPVPSAVSSTSSNVLPTIAAPSSAPSSWRPALFTITTRSCSSNSANASCTASTAEVRYAVARRFSISRLRRSLMSRMPAVTSSPEAVSIGDRLISIGNSEPSLRAPRRSRPLPIGRSRGAVVNPETCS